MIELEESKEGKESKTNAEEVMMANPEETLLISLLFLRSSPVALRRPTLDVGLGGLRCC